MEGSIWIVVGLVAIYFPVRFLRDDQFARSYIQNSPKAFLWRKANKGWSRPPHGNHVSDLDSNPPRNRLGLVGRFWLHRIINSLNMLGTEAPPKINYRL